MIYLLTSSLYRNLDEQSGHYVPKELYLRTYGVPSDCMSNVLISNKKFT